MTVFTHIMESDVLAEERDEEYAVRLELELEVHANDSDDAYAEVLSVAETDDPMNVKFLDYPNLSAELREEIENEAQSFADGKAYDVWHDKLIGEAEAKYDAMKEDGI